MKEIICCQAFIYSTEVHLSLQFPHPTTAKRPIPAAEEEIHAATRHPWDRPCTALPPPVSGSPHSRPHSASNTSGRASVASRPLTTHWSDKDDHNLSSFAGYLLRVSEPQVASWHPLLFLLLPTLNIRSCLKMPQSIWKNKSCSASDGEMGKYSSGST